MKTAGCTLLRRPKLIHEYRHGILTIAKRRHLRAGSELAKRCQLIEQRIARSMGPCSILGKQQRLLILDYVSAGTHLIIILRDRRTSIQRTHREKRPKFHRSRLAATPQRVAGDPNLRAAVARYNNRQFGSAFS